MFNQQFALANQIPVSNCSKYGNNSFGNQIRYEDSGLVEDWSKILKPVGKLRAILIPLDTPDKRHVSSIKDLEDFSNELMKEISRISRGKLTLETEVLDQWITLPESGQDYETNLNWWQKINDAISYSDSFVDFSKYDLALFKHDEKASSISSAGALPMWEQNLPDGIKVLRGAYIGRDYWVANGLGVSEMIHEILHVFGLPDLYMTNNDGSVPVGIYDVMSTFSKQFKVDLLNWHLWKLGWLESEKVICVSKDASQKFVLQTDDRLKFIVIPINNNEVLALEIWKNAPENEVKVLAYKVDTLAFVWRSQGDSGTRSPIQMLRPFKSSSAAKSISSLNLGAALEKGDQIIAPEFRIRFAAVSGSSVIITYTPNGMAEVDVSDFSERKSICVKKKIVLNVSQKGKCPKGFKLKYS